MRSRTHLWLMVLLFLPALASGTSSAADLQGEARRLNQQGIERAQQGDFVGALDLFARATEIYARAGDGAGKAKGLQNQARALWDLGHRERAVERYQEALPLFRAAGDKVSEASILVWLGGLQDELGNHERSRDLFLEALPLVEAENDPERLSILLGGLGNQVYKLGKPEEALAWLERSARAAEAAKSPARKVAALGYMSIIHFERASWERALSLSREELSLREEIGDPRKQADVLKMIGLSSAELGRVLEALSALQEELALREAIGDPEPLGDTLHRLSLFYGGTGDYDKCRELQERIYKLALDSGNLKGQAAAVYSVALFQQMLGRSDLAHDRFLEALRLFRAIEDRSGEADVLLQLGLLRREENAREAIDLLEQALRRYREIGSEIFAAVVLSRLIPLYVQVDSRDKIQEQLPWLTRMAAEVEPLERTAFLGNLALSHLRLGQVQSARPFYEELLTLARANGQPLEEAEALEGLGLTHEFGGNPERALELYKSSIALREGIRASARLDFLKERLASASTDVYESALRVCLRLGRTTEAFELSERARARSLLDSLAGLRLEGRGSDLAGSIRRERELRAEIEALEGRLAKTPAVDREALRSRLADRRKKYDEVLAEIRSADPASASLLGAGAPASTQALQGLLDANTTLVSYFMTSETVLAFVLTRSSLSVHLLPVDAGELARTLEHLRKAPKGALPEIVRSLVERLSPWLVAPLADHLRTQKVGLVPHGLLHHVPFAALSANGRPLGERYTLFHLPSASSLLYLRRGPRETEGAPALSLAYSPEQSPLPKALPEAEEVSRIWGGDLVHGAEARVDTVLSRASGFRILHFAAHGILESKHPLSSRIHLAPGKTDDGSLYLHQIYNLDLRRTKLVVLSACESGVGPASRGDEIAALGHGFFHAGASAVVASLWRVEDGSTQTLMTSFHRHLKKGLGEAEALAAAQAELRRSESFAEPYHWAGFVLMGDPGERPGASAR